MAVGDWILILDADEVISPLDYAALERIVKKRPAKPVAYTMVTRNYTNEVAAKGWAANDRRYGREEAGTGWFPSLKVRLFINDRRILFQNPVHEFVEASLEKAGIDIKACDIPVHHYGRFDKDKLIKKGKEYFLLGKQKIEEMNGDIKALKELAVQASELGEYETGVELWKKVIDLDSDGRRKLLLTLLATNPTMVLRALEVGVPVKLWKVAITDRNNSQNKINVIKTFREVTGNGLADSKAWAEGQTITDRPSGVFAHSLNREAADELLKHVT